MTLTNQHLIMLSKFASKAKKHIGLVKAVEMLNDEQYACDILSQAMLSNNPELVDLTKKISYEFDVGINLTIAIESFIKGLKEKDTTDDFVHNSKYFLIKLTHYLYGIKVNGALYRQAVEKLLLNVDMRERTFCINLAREFYPNWRGANKSQTEINNEKTLRLNAKKEAFIKLWESIDQEFLSDAESWPLSLYAESLRKLGVSERDINISQSIAKVITLELRNDPSSPNDNYRNAINTTQEFFVRPDLNAFFLIVSREFYQFWIGNIPRMISVL